MIVVADSTPLIYLAAIGRFDLLPALFGNVLIPPAVYAEVVTQGVGQWGASEVTSANWIKQQDIHDRNKSAALLNLIGPGESEAIVFAEELHADLVCPCACPFGAGSPNEPRAAATWYHETIAAPAPFVC